MSPRTLTLNFPDGASEYWFSDIVFTVGDRLERGGATWIVTHVSEAVGRDKHEHLTLCEDDPSDTGTDTYYVRPA
jgi:hypothetical protein